MAHFSPHYIALSHIPLVLHLVEHPHSFRAVTVRAAIDSRLDDGLFNECEQWEVGGQDRELSRECNVGNKVCVVSVSAVDSTPRDVSVSQRPLMACYELIILI